MTTAKKTRRDFMRTAAAVATGALGRAALDARVYAAGADIIKVGVIGCGGRGQGAAMNAMGADPGIRLVAVTDIFPERSKGARDGLKKQKPTQVEADDAHCFSGTDGYQKVIEAADVVLIACAAKFHAFYAKAAVTAGKHVFVEKPHAIDPAGCKDILAAGEIARQKKLSIVSGLQSRYDPCYQETVKRIHEGAIGDVVAIEENFLRGPYGLYPRRPGLKEVEYHFFNQYHFAWLSGDDVPQSLVHNMDRALWVLRDQPPVKCHGLGGRATSFGEIYGNVFDHHSVIYEFANGARVYAFCRTANGCYNEVSSIVLGSKGRCNLLAGRIEGENKWVYQGRHPSPYDIEHQKLFAAIRSGEPVINTDYMARSTLTTVMGQLSCYTGKEFTWDQATKSDWFYPPAPAACTLDMEPPTTPGEKGLYPVPVPGVTKMG